MKKRAFWTLAVFAILCLASVGIYAAVGDYTLLREFAGGAADGSMPQSQGLATDGTKLYGGTWRGGASGMGTIYSVNMDGTGYTTLRHFTGLADDGGWPISSFVNSGTKLYGTTILGGDSNEGVVFSINTDGTGFALLHEFAGGAGDGATPFGTVLLSGTKLYGTTRYGGDSDYGLIYSLNTDGTGFEILHEFEGGAGDGARADSSLILSGGTLYGMTDKGGDADLGTIFSIKTDGTGYTLLREFAGGADDGSTPYGALTLSGSKLFGMTSVGGDADSGTIFSINTDGTGFALLREFAGGAADGSMPYGSLALSGTKLYGMTTAGGDADAGVLFSIEPSGANFTLLKEFTGLDGSGPANDAPLVSGNFIYGVTMFGGATGVGVVFKYEFQAPPPPAIGCFINTLF